MYQFATQLTRAHFSSYIPITHIHTPTLTHTATVTDPPTNSHPDTHIHGQRNRHLQKLFKVPRLYPDPSPLRNWMKDERWPEAITAPLSGTLSPTPC